MVARLNFTLMRLFLFALGLGPLLATAQLARHIDQETAEQLYLHERFLSSDALGGRLPGSEGGAEAARYIQAEMSRIGLSPMFDDRFTQDVKIPDASKVSATTNYLVLGKDSAALRGDFWPSMMSGNGRASGSLVWANYGLSLSGQDDWQKVKPQSVVVLMRDVPKNLAAKAGKAAGLQSRLAEAKKRGAVAVIVLAPQTGPAKLDLLRRIRPIGIPVVEVHNPKWVKRLGKQAKKGKKTSLSTELIVQHITAPNVGGWIDRGKQRTIVIGAHYDHVGSGEWGSRKPELAGQVHNGADDNASGTSVLLTLAKMLAKIPELGDANLAFVAFTGEESGLIGSKHFVETMPAPFGKVTTMLNLDMVGRLNRSDSLRVYGVHTGYEFAQMLESIPAEGFYWDLRNEIFGRSDHAPFIEKEIPSVFFFTGLHEDYHAPGDDFEKLDIEGMAAVTGVAYRFIQLLAENLSPNFNPESREQ